MYGIFAITMQNDLFRANINVLNWPLKLYNVNQVHSFIRMDLLANTFMTLCS